MFHNIFSNRKSSPKEKIKIIADEREKNSLVIAELSAQNIEVSLQHLEIADYLINNIAIERKTKSDLISSIFNKRIFTQLENLKQYPQSLLIIEDNPSEEGYIKINENILKGFCLSTTLDHKIPIIFTKNAKDTAIHLSLLAKRNPQESSLRPKIPLSPNQQLQFVIEGFPGIGPATAKALLTRYKTIKSIINAPQEEITSLLGKKSERFLSLLNQEYSASSKNSTE